MKPEKTLAIILFLLSFLACNKDQVEVSQPLNFVKRMDFPVDVEYSDDCTTATDYEHRNLHFIPFVSTYSGFFVDDLPSSITYNTYVEKPVTMGVYENRGYFNKRGNRIFVKIPFWYYTNWTLDDCYGIERIDQPFVNIEGEHLGEITDKQITCGRSGYAGLPYQMISFQCSASERRTIIISTNGVIKIVSGLNAEFFHMGNEIEYGFTIQSASNEVGTYSYNGNVEVLRGIRYPGEEPYPRFKTNASGYNYGIQRN